MHPAPTSTEPRSCRQRRLPHRVPDFAFDAETPPIWTPLHPELACIANAVSLMMPHVEPLIVRTGAQAPEDILAPKRIDEASLQRCAELGQALAAGLPGVDVIEPEVMKGISL